MQVVARAEKQRRLSETEALGKMRLLRVNPLFSGQGPFYFPFWWLSTSPCWPVKVNSCPLVM